MLLAVRQMIFKLSNSTKRCQSFWESEDSRVLAVAKSSPNPAKATAAPYPQVQTVARLSVYSQQPHIYTIHTHISTSLVLQMNTGRQHSTQPNANSANGLILSPSLPDGLKAH